MRFKRLRKFVAIIIILFMILAGVIIIIGATQGGGNLNNIPGGFTANGNHAPIPSPTFNVNAPAAGSVKNTAGNYSTINTTLDH